MRLLAALAVFTTLAIGGPAQANLVVNGGFETGTLSSWIQSGNTGFTGVDNTIAHSGSYGAFIGPVGSIGQIRQVISTTPGESYDLSFWLSNASGSSTNAYTVSWGGNILASVVNAPAFGYTQQLFAVTATATTTTLAFAFRHDPSFYYLDDISVTARTSPVPAPGALALLGIGLASLAVARRRKQ